MDCEPASGGCPAWVEEIRDSYIVLHELLNDSGLTQAEFLQVLRNDFSLLLVAALERFADEIVADA